ncbi:MAG: AAA family ATPase [Myxococcales bacterium]|nr:AAA family ATPase [Myxococcales bacterium]
MVLVTHRLGRYELISPIGEGGMGTVFRVHDRLGGRFALKRMRYRPNDLQRRSSDRQLSATAPMGPSPRGDSDATPASIEGADATRSELQRAALAGDTAASSLSERPLEDDSDDDERAAWRLQLAREFRLLASLRHPNIVSVVDFAFDDQLDPYFTMELLESATTIADAARPLPIVERVRLVQQMLLALSYLHRNGVFHADLKPGNVLVLDGRVKVLDFGISTLRDYTPGTPRIWGGTLAYMAPELLASASPTAATDLYAVGVILFELLTNRSPFDRTSSAALTYDVMVTRPDCSEIDERFAPIVARLLEKEPEARFGTAHELSIALDRAIEAYESGQPRSTAALESPLGALSVASRESSLRSARLVGRESILAEFDRAIDHSIEGRGGGMLLGGESGVGKSRLLDELRVRAMVRGATVIVGQEISEGREPYQGFRGALRVLAATVELSDDEASVFAELVPDIDAILGRPVAVAPTLDAETTHARLLATVEQVLRRLARPVVLVIEDLHWAGDETVKLVARIARVAVDLPLLVIASYRDDERPALAQALSALRSLAVPRLERDAIASLARSIVGPSNASDALVRLLERETEGNPLFVVEAIRSLTELAGDLERVGSTPLPTSVALGGVRALLTRRLARLSPPALALAARAAVLGRAIDRALLEHIAGDLQIDWWIDECSAAAVLEFYDGSLRFAHDKLREAAVATLDRDALGSVHRAVATAIEGVYASDLAPHYAQLAHHWTQGEERARAVHYHDLAGRQALDAYANASVVEHFSNALALDEALRGPLEVDVQRARWHRHLAEGLYSLVRHAEALEHYRKSMTLCGFSAPKPGLATLEQAFSHVAGRFAPAPPPPDPALRERCIEAMRAADNLQVVALWLGDRATLVHAAFEAANIARIAGSSPESAHAISMVGYLGAVAGLRSVALRDLRHAVAMAEREGVALQRCSTAVTLGMTLTLLGQPSEAHATLERADAVARELGAGLWKHRARFMRAEPLFLQGRYAEAARLFDEVRPLAADVEPPVVGFAQCVRALAVHRLGDRDGARSLLYGADGLAAVRPKGTKLQVCTSLAGAIELHIAAGELDAALALAEEGLALSSHGEDTYSFAIGHLGHAAIALAFLSLWRRSSERGDRDAKAYRKKARIACDRVRKASWLFPCAAPAYLLREGLFQKLDGRPRRAIALFERAYARAESMEAAYEAGCAAAERATLGDDRPLWRARSERAFVARGIPSVAP